MALTPEQFRTRFTKAFPVAVRIVAPSNDFVDSLAVLGEVNAQPPGRLRVTLFTEPDKDLIFYISNVVENDKEWLVSTPRGVWVFRPPTDSARAEKFAAAMREG